MKIKTEFIPRMSLEHFADQYNLTMKVTERREPSHIGARYYAMFERVEVKNGHCLTSVYGNGTTPEEAIHNYKKEIELKTIVVGSHTKERREIQVPRIA